VDFGPCSTQNSRFIPEMPLEDLWATQQHMKFADFFGEFSWIFGPCSTPNSRFIPEMLPRIYPYSSMRSSRFYDVEEPRIFIEYIAWRRRAAWTSNNKYHSCELSVGAELIRPSWDSRVGLTLIKMCVFFLIL